jgi:hypothetical protein
VRQWIRSHLTYANVMVTVLAFVVLGGGTAFGAYVITSNSQVGPDTIAGHHSPNPGDHANIIGGSINTQDVAYQTLVGASDIRPFSGVDSCKYPLTTQLGGTCAGSNGSQKTWQDADQYCADNGLRLPSLSEAVTMARKYDVPNFSAGQFWTDDLFYGDPRGIGGGGTYYAFTVDEAGQTRVATTGIQVDHPGDLNHGVLRNVVCVTDPTN